jgi:5-formyltetrahydrofolate cyclo-ligase
MRSVDVREDVKKQRRAARKRLLAMRRTYLPEPRGQATARVLANLTAVCDNVKCETLGIYWPIKGEIEICHWAAQFANARGARTALPVVVKRNCPLEYWQWYMGEPLTPGFWNIPVPARRVPVDPTTVVIPLVGFYDLYRLGYGGGYFDRTLAARAPRPTAIGIGYEVCRLRYFIPLPHDIPMDFIVTDRTISSRDAGPNLP